MTVMNGNKAMAQALPKNSQVPYCVAGKKCAGTHQRGFEKPEPPVIDPARVHALVVFNRIHAHQESRLVCKRKVLWRQGDDFGLHPSKHCRRSSPSVPLFNASEKPPFAA